MFKCYIAMQQPSQREECRVCFEEVKYPRAQPLGCPKHYYHRDCLLGWARRGTINNIVKNTCPLCCSMFWQIKIKENSSDAIEKEENVIEEVDWDQFHPPSPLPAQNPSIWFIPAGMESDSDKDYWLI